MLRKSKAKKSSSKGHDVKCVDKDNIKPRSDEKNIKKQQKDKWQIGSWISQYFRKKDYIRTFLIVGSPILLLILYNLEEENFNDNNSIYDFTVKNIHGNDIDLSIYKGNVSILVNVASECGYTEDNYEILTHLQRKKINGNPVKILAFPCNQFGEQEPGSPVDILNFAKQRKAEFDFFEKVEVIGENAHPLFKVLEKQFGPIQWNFYKFIIDEDGVPLRRFPSSPELADIASALSDLFVVEDDYDDE